MTTIGDERMKSQIRHGSRLQTQSLRRRGRRRIGESLIAGLLFACALVSIVTTLAVVLVLSVETLGFFREVSIVEFFTNPEWTPLFLDRNFGIAPLVSGTLLVTTIAVAVGAPLGLGAACYLSEFADVRQRRRILPVIELLAGIPTVVLGYFALLFVTPLLRDVISGVDLFNPLSAGIVMGFMILPTICSVSVDAMQAVPRSLREAAYGLGAAKHQLVLRVVIPAALSGIVASLILAVSRAIGETMIVTLAAGQRPDLHFDPRKTIATMTSFVVQAATGDQPAGSVAARSLYAVASTLFVMTLALNLTAQAIVRRFREAYA
ncbi:MAG: phosphate ABC transporter permease subunit PstC [Trueperaceae bacterium]|nr:phosphate ABC transporter permease subunit PstC [Trueperaceae bacterium]